MKSDTVDKKKKGKDSIEIGKKKRPIQGVETNVRFLGHTQIPLCLHTFGSDVLM